MMRALFAGVSGLRNHQIRMDVIGNNIANVNTIGFKASRVNFKELFSQTIRGAAEPQDDRGGTNPMQVGLGMGIANIDSIMEPGNVQVTGKATDLAIDGEGYFILNNHGTPVYTRAGLFDFDRDGYLVNPDGLRVLGWNAVNGVLPQPDAHRLSEIRIPVDEFFSASATTKVTYGKNLNSGSDAMAVATFVDFGKNLDSGAAVGTIVNTTVNVYDSYGELHTLTVDFEKTNIDEWQYTITGPGVNQTGVLTFDGTGAITASPDNTPSVTFSPPSGADLAIDFDFSGITQVAGASDVGVTDQDGSAIDAENSTFTTVIDVYDSLGQLHPVTVAFGKVDENIWRYVIDGPNGGAEGFLVFNTDGSLNTTASDAPVTVTFAPDSAAELNIEFDFSGLTQFAGSTTAEAVGRNGHAMGMLDSITFDTSGVITGIFSNGLTQPLAQIALASFANPGGLLNLGGSLFAGSNNSGLAQVGLAGTAGKGTIAPGSLEMSNVDLSQEFTNMIVTQRGFQANARIITASDEMLQELANLKR